MGRRGFGARRTALSALVGRWTRPLSRAHATQRLTARVAAVSLVALAAACSGTAFQLAEDERASDEGVGFEPGAGGSSTFPALVTNGNGGDVSSDGGAGGAEPPGADGAPPSSGGSPADGPSNGAGAMNEPEPTDAVDAGASGSTASDDGEPDAAPPPASEPEPTPSVGPCGVPRTPDLALRDAEVCVPAGTFSMGSAASPSAGYLAHGPVHDVTLSAYFLDVYEVTVARYRACVSAGACSAPGTTLAQGCTYTDSASSREAYPVTCVSWNDAQAFCAWDGARRLPTEAEWENAARNAAGSRYPWGETFSCERAVLAGASQCDDDYAGTAPRAVGTTPTGASEEGVMDLAGNAAEWVADWFGPYAADPVTDPTGPASGSSRIQRGGGWLTPAAEAVSYARRGAAPDATGSFSFRCARDAEPATP